MLCALELLPKEFTKGITLGRWILNPVFPVRTPVANRLLPYYKRGNQFVKKFLITLLLILPTSEGWKAESIFPSPLFDLVGLPSVVEVYEYGEVRAVVGNLAQLGHSNHSGRSTQGM